MDHRFNFIDFQNSISFGTITTSVFIEHKTILSHFCDVTRRFFQKQWLLKPNESLPLFRVAQYFFLLCESREIFLHKTICCWVRETFHVKWKLLISKPRKSLRNNLEIISTSSSTLPNIFFPPVFAFTNCRKEKQFHVVFLSFNTGMVSKQES